MSGIVIQHASCLSRKLCQEGIEIKELTCAQVGLADFHTPLRFLEHPWVLVKILRVLRFFINVCSINRSGNNPFHLLSLRRITYNELSSYVQGCGFELAKSRID